MTIKYVGFRQLTSALHFYTAAIDETPLLAFQNAELIGTGRIEEIRSTDEGDVVVINGEHFIKRNVTFVYAK